MARLPRVFSMFWASDRGLSLLNLFLIGLLFFVSPATDAGFLGRLLLDLFFVLILLAGVAVVSGNRRHAPLVTAVAVIQLVTQVLRHVPGGVALDTLNLLSTFVFLGLLASAVLAQVFREGPINFHRIQGAIAVYMMIGVMWGCLYQALQVNSPGAFLVGGIPSSAATHPETFFYFSFVTLTTVGFGDVTPLHHLARSLAMMEALTGQLFPTILIARLVAMSITSRK